MKRAHQLPGKGGVMAHNMLGNIRMSTPTSTSPTAAWLLVLSPIVFDGAVQRQRGVSQQPPPALGAQPVGTAALQPKGEAAPLAVGPRGAGQQEDGQYGGNMPHRRPRLPHPQLRWDTAQGSLILRITDGAAELAWGHTNRRNVRV